MFGPYLERLRKLAILAAQKPAAVFVVLALTFGLIFIFSLPPLSGTDEFSHFPRVYQITDGRLWERKLPNDQYGGYLPTNINNMINDYRNLSRESTGSQYLSNAKSLDQKYSSITSVGSKKTAAIFTSVVIYPPWAYAPSVAGVLAAKTFHLPLIWYVYMGRLFALLAWIVLVAVAIRFMPSGKWFLATIALLPTSLTQAASISADGLVNGLSWLVIAMALAILAKQVKLSWKMLLPLTLAMVYLGISKESYWLIALFPLIMPLSLFRTKQHGIAWRLGAFGSVVAAAAWFTLINTKRVSNVILTPTVGVNVNTRQQIHYLLHHLLAFTARALWEPFTKSFDTIYLGMVGIYTNRLIYLSILLISLLFFSLYFGVRNTRVLPEFRGYSKSLPILAALAIVGTYLLIAVSFYLTETSVGSAYVTGMYGRYLLPILPLFAIFPMVFRYKHYASPTWTAYVPVVISVIALSATILSIQ